MFIQNIEEEINQERDLEMMQSLRYQIPHNDPIGQAQPFSVEMSYSKKLNPLKIVHLKFYQNHSFRDLQGKTKISKAMILMINMLH